MDFQNKTKDAEIAARRKEKEDFFNANISTLLADETKRFNELLDDLLQQKQLIRGMHDAAIKELEWDKLPLFLKDKGIKTFRDSNIATRLFLTIRDGIAKALRPKPATGFELPDGELVDKK